MSTNISRRGFLRHSAGAGLTLGASSLLHRVPAAYAAAQADQPLHVCLVSGSEEYKSNESLASLQEYLEHKELARCSRAFWKSTTDLPGLDALETCDVMVLFTKRLELPDSQLDRVKEYCRAGRPIVGLRTASHAFENWLILDQEILGGNYKGHYRSGPITKIETADGAAGHPILKNFQPFDTPTKLYKNPTLAKGTELLLTGTIPDHREPLAWTHVYRGGRVFYTSLGGPDDFARDTFRNMIVNALFWTTKRERPRQAP